MHVKQPNSLHCFVCGVKNPYGLRLSFYQTADDEVSLDTTISEEFNGYPGIVHGGIVASMLDEAAGRALMGTDPTNSRFMFTARLDIQYRKPAPVGQPLRVVGRAIKKKDRSATAKATLSTLDGEILAEADAVLVDIPAEMLNSPEVERLGWKVYP